MSLLPSGNDAGDDANLAKRRRFIERSSGCPFAKSVVRGESVERVGTSATCVTSRHASRDRLRNKRTRSSAQSNCSAKSLAGNVADSSLSSLSSKGGPRVGGGSGGRGFRGRGSGGGGWGGGLGGGAGDISSSCHRLHHHMVLHRKGTSHNEF